jgi:hypothetical protein
VTLLKNDIEVLENDNDDDETMVDDHMWIVKMSKKHQQ